MLAGVFQRLRIAEQTGGRLALVEWPALELFFMGLLALAAINMALFQLWLTAGATLVVIGIIASLARLRWIIFSVDEGTLTVIYQHWYRRRIINRVALSAIRGVRMDEYEDGASQIVLATNEGDLGLSVYSRDLRPWKLLILAAIEDFLAGASDGGAAGPQDA